MRVTFYVVPLRRLVPVTAIGVIGVLLVAMAVGRAAKRPHHLAGWLIAVDAGHGGPDKGAWFPDTGLVEKDINLHVAKTLGQYLAAEGAAVLLLREDDTFVQLGDRALQANRAKARVFVSIHVNRFPADTTCCGAQVFYQRGSAEGQRLAKLVQEQLRVLDSTNKRQAVTGDYKVLRESQMAAILVEMGFATNARDRRLIMDPTYRRGVAAAIRDGLIRYSLLQRAEPPLRPRTPHSQQSQTSGGRVRTRSLPESTPSLPLRSQLT
jgi:N-acetylmuramoyl-L-alanine amidase